MSRERRVGLLMAFSTAVLWGFLAIAMKVAAREVPVTTVVWFRFTAACLLLAFGVGLRRPQRLGILLRPPGLAILGGVCLATNYLTFMAGLERTTPSFAQVLIQLGPLLLAVSGVLVFKEHLSRAQALGAGLAVVGFGLFYADQWEVEAVSRADLLAGIGLLVVAAVTWTAYAVFQKLLVQRGRSPQDLNLVFYVLPALVLWPWVDFEVLGGLTPGMWALMAFLGANTLLAYGALGEALERLPAYQVSLIIIINPLITLVAMAVLQALELSWVPVDRVGVLGYGAAGLVVAGIAQVLVAGARGVAPRS